MVKKRVAVGFSGGKDSTTAAILLKKEGYDVLALTMMVGLKNEEEKIAKIKNLAKYLDIPLRTVDMREVFKEKVIDYFISSYAQGRTPNPCVVCNKLVKFNLLQDYAKEKEDCSLYATGHYADKIKIDGDLFLKEPADRKKSQIYFLSMINRERLGDIIFPIANLKIEDIRQIVKGLPLANKQESQDVCFLQGVNLMDYLREFIPEKFKEGDILDIKGNRVGTHRGAIYFTIGQRRGTRFSSDRKLYVVKTDVENNTITLSDEKYLFSDSIEVVEPVFWKSIKAGEVYNVKVRYLSKFAQAEITEVSGDYIRARFRTPVRAVTPGQIGAFYDNDIIAAAGFIE
jgi:tRNA-specific 2-thiouridylase